MLEVDELHVARVAEAVDPEVLVLLNLSRDQLDRGSEVRAVAAALSGALVRIALPQQPLGEPVDMSLQRSQHDRPQHLDHDASLSTVEKQASIKSPDYADLASSNPVPRNRSQLNLGITRRSA